MRRAYPTAGENPKNRKSIANSRQAKSRQDESNANSRQTRAMPTAGEKNIEDLEEDGKDSKSDTVKESIAESKVETMPGSEPKATTKPKAEPTAETKAEAKADAKAKSTPKPVRVDRTGGDWEVIKEADVRGFSQATTVAVALQNAMAVGSTPAPFCSGGAAET